MEQKYCYGKIKRLIVAGKALCNCVVVTVTTTAHIALESCDLRNDFHLWLMY